VSRPLRISLTNEQGRPELNVPDAPQQFRVGVTNLGPRPLRTASESFVLTLRFRRGTLVRTHRLRLAAHSAREWRLEHRSVDNGDEVLEFRRRYLRLDPDEREDIVLVGVTADERGGTRTTRVETSWSGMSPVASEPLAETKRTSLVLLVVRRAHEVGGSGPTRTGSVGRAGPFVAGAWPIRPLAGPSTSSEGAGATTGDVPTWPKVPVGEPVSVFVAMVNVSGRALRLSGDDDAASKIEVDVPRAEHAAPWGLVAAQGDRFAIDLVRADDPRASEMDDDPSDVVDPEDWFVHHLTIRSLADGHWADRHRLVVELSIHSSTMPGCIVPVRLRYVDFPDLDDGEVVVLLETVAAGETSDAAAVATP